MSGHNKWSSIKHKKAAADAKRGQVFSKLAKEITVAARTGGGNPEANFALRAAIQKARVANMPADNIDRAIKKGTGELAGETLEEIVYEGYAMGGVAILVEVLTDNRNRATAEVKHAFSKYEASLAGQGSVSRSFQRKGDIFIRVEAVEEDKLIEIALEAGAEDVRRDGQYFEVLTEPGAYHEVVEVLEEASIPIENAEIALLPENTMPVVDKKAAGQLLKFIETLDELEDVRHVYANFDIDDQLIAELESA